MPGAIRAVDEIASAVASAVAQRWESFPEDAAEARRQSDTEPAPPLELEELTEPFASVAPQAPAGIVRVAGEELFEAIESEEDIVRANRELLEGTPQTTEQHEQWRRLYGEIMNEANKRLRGRQVMLMVAVPNPNGLGCVFTGLDLARFEAARNGVLLPGGEDYEVVLTLPAAERVDLRKAGREEFVRKFIDVICDAVLEQKAQYDCADKRLK